MKNQTVFFVAVLGFAFLFSSAFTAQDDLPQSIARGKVIYEELCVTCHLADGTGMEGAFPPLAKADYLTKNRDASIRAVKYGQEGEITVNGQTYNNMMPAPGLSEKEVADVLNYVLNSWGNKGKPVTVQQVESVKEE